MNIDTLLRATALAALAAGASGCATIDTGEIAQDALAAPGAAYAAARRGLAAPALAPVGTPASLTGAQQQTMPQPTAMTYEPAAPNSLWRAGSRSFFNDQRASRIGDILTVLIEIDDSAQVSNTSNRSRSGSTSAGLGRFFGLEETLSTVIGGDADQLIEAESESTHNGTGAINRAEKIELTVAAVIVDQLQNGNLVLAGRQEVRINGEVRELTVSGVIRPEDITSSNTINHSEMAEARISYGGRGQISSVQRPGWGQRIGDAISPW